MSNKIVATVKKGGNYVFQHSCGGLYFIELTKSDVVKILRQYSESEESHKPADKGEKR